MFKIEDEDLEVWDHFKKSVTELKQKKTKYDDQTQKKLKHIEVKSQENDDIFQLDIDISHEDKLIEIDNFKGIDKNLYRNIIAGKINPESTLDLHGFTISEAERLVISFINKSYSKGMRLLLVITGKGDVNNNNTLKKNLSKFLNSQEIKSMILFASTSAPKHGGTGAYYVFLRKKR